MKLRIASFLLLFFVCFPIKSQCQIAISNIDEIAKIKTGTTFFAMKDPASPKAAAYVEAIKKYWTFSKVECIKYTDVEKNIAPNNSFVTLGAKMTSSGSGATETDFSLEFWTTDGKYVYDPKKRRHYNQEEKILIASIALFPDFFLQNNPSTAYKTDYDGAGHFKNWGAGVFANYIQQLNTYLDKPQKKDAGLEFTDRTGMNKLASSTLYIPDYVLTKFSKNSDDESKKSDEKKLFQGITMPYKLVTIEELNEKVTTESEGFLYLLFIKTNEGRYVTITNSKTGQIIYTVYSRSNANFDSGDLKEIQNSLKKK